MKNETYEQVRDAIKKANRTEAEKAAAVEESKPGFPAKDPNQDVGKPTGVAANDNKSTGKPENTNVDTAPATAASVEKLATKIGSIVQRVAELSKSPKVAGACDTDKDVKPKVVEKPAETVTEKKAAAETDEGGDDKTASAEEVKTDEGGDDKTASAEEVKTDEGGDAKTAKKDDIIPAFTDEFHMKLAGAILESEEGIAFAEQILLKKAGAEQAQELIVNALEQQEYAKIAAAAEYEEQMQNAQELEFCEGLVEEFKKTASAEDLALAAKMAEAHAAALETLPHEWAKCAYMDGAADAAGMSDAMGVEGGDQMMGADEPMGIEEILEVIAMLVESGQLDEAQAQQIAEGIIAEMGGEAGPEEMKAASVLIDGVKAEKSAAVAAEAKE